MPKLIKPVIDLTRSHFVKPHGDITVHGTWYLGDKEGEWPCLVLVPTYRQFTMGWQPCVVTVDLAWIWSEEHGDPEFAAETAASFAESLGILGGMNAAIRVAGVIRDHLGDLLSIPPRPQVEQKIVGDFIACEAETGKTHHIAMKDDANVRD
jgi:hypothetical protein